MMHLRGKLVWFFCCVMLAAGLMSAASDVVHAQTTLSFLLRGTVTDSNGVPVTGLTVGIADTNTQFVTRGDGTYDMVLLVFSAQSAYTVGDTLAINVTDGDESVAGLVYTITAEDLASTPPGATVNIQLSGLEAVVTPNSLPADGKSTAPITTNIVVAGAPVSGDTVTITAEKGTVGDVTDNGDGTYSATYTAPDLILTDPTTDIITIASADTGDTTTTTVTLEPVRTLISVTATPSSFVAGSGIAGMVNVNVSRGGDPVTDAEISISSSRADGGADAGTVGDVTGSGDGSYSAPYAPSNTAGRIMLSATDAVSGENGSATVTVNAGAPSTLAISANPMEVSSGGSAMISATVADANGNGVGGQSPSGSAGSGSVGDFTEGRDVGSYTATYTAPMVDAEGTDIVTVSVGDLTGVATVSLTPVPPIMVGVLAVSGTINKADGTGSVPGVNVNVTVNDKAPISTTSDENGNYSATIVDPGGNAASTGDTVTVVVTDADGDERGSEGIVLTNEDLGASAVKVDVTTDYGALTSALAVTGSVFREASEIAIDDVFDITVTNTTNGMQVSGMTDGSGMYSLTLFDTSAPVAETGDMITVTASKDGGQVGAVTRPITSAEVDAGRAEINVPTGIKASTSALVVAGTVYHEDGTIEMGAGLTVTVMSPSRGLESSATTDANGMYDVTFFDASAPVGETGDMLSVTVMQDGARIGAMDYALTSADVDAQRATVDVSTGAIASTSTLVVTGAVYFLESDIPVGPNIPVHVVNVDNGMEGSGMTDADGMYSVTFFSSSAPAAETGDALNVTVMHGDETVASVTHNVMASEIDSQRAVVNVPTSIKAESSVFNVTGTVYLEDGVSPAPPGLTVKVTNVNQGIADDGWTTDDGTYSVTIVSASMAVARSADELTLDVTVMADTDVVGTTSHTLTTDQVVARRISGVDITCDDLTADPSNVIVVGGSVANPDGTSASAGVEVRLTLGSNPTRELTTNAGGGYLTTFFNPDAPVVKVHDTLTAVAVDRQAGSAANESMDVASHHVLARRITFDIALIADTIDPVAVAKSSQKFIQKTESVDFDGSESSDYITPTVPGIIDSYLWDFGDGNTADTMNATHQYANSGAYIATLTVTDLAGNEDSMSLEIFVDTVRLGGMSLNTLHARDVIDKIITLAIARTDVGQNLGAEALLEMVRGNPAMQQAVLKSIATVLPEGMLPAQLLDSELPLIFEDYENIDLENFGNALTARPGSGMGILDSKDGGFARVIAGNKLDLYLATPRGDVGSVTFRLDGPDFDPLSEEGTRDAREAVAGMSMMHTFQLEEQQAILRIPSWPGLSEGSGAFASVTLRYAADDLPPEYANLLSRARQVPPDAASYASAPLSPTVINGEIVWSAEVGIEPGKIYYYFYEIELNTPVPYNLGDGASGMLSRYAFPDPRNLQLEDRGLIDGIFTPAVQEAIAPFLNPILDAVLAGQDLSTVNLLEIATGENLGMLLGALTGATYSIYMDVSTGLDPHMVSVFTVPMSTTDQSVWYTTIDLSDLQDGVHTIDANAFDSNGVQIDNRPVFGKTFELDRSAPAIGLAVENGQNSAMYTRDDGVLITTGLITPDPEQLASLILNGSTMDSTEDMSQFMYQIIRHNDDPMMQMENVWSPIVDPTMPPSIEGLTPDQFNAFLNNSISNMLTINALIGVPGASVHPFEMIIRGIGDNPPLIVGEYGIRAVAKDDVGNLSSYTAPVRVDIVSPDPDKAIIANIELGDCNRDGDLQDPFESGPPSADSTIFANTLNVKLTVEIPNRTPHPLTDIVVQYKSAHGTAQWMDIATIDAPGVVEWNIDNFDVLFNSGGDQRIYVRAVATNALTITDPDPAMPAIKLDGDVCPVEPEHIAVNVVPAGTNEETGGACGILTVDGYTAARTIPDLASVRFDMTLPDGTTMTVGEATESEVLSPVETADLTAILANLVNTVVDGIPTASQEVGYRKWSISFNSAPLADSLDTAYVINATMIGADGMEYAPIAGGSDSFLLHNGDVEVGTTIVQVADAYGALPGDAGFHQLGGILMDGLDTPIGIFTVDPAAPDWRVAGVNLIVNVRNADGSKGDAVDVGEVTVEETVSVDMADMTKTSSDKIYTVTITDLSGLGVGGDYVIQALAHDSKAEPDVEAEDASLGTAVNVDNYTPPPNITIDGRGEGMSLADFMAAHPLGYRIAQSDDNMFPFSVNAPGVLMGEITVQIDGGTLADDLVTIDGMRHDFSIVASTSTTDEGDHPASGTVTKRNGSASFDLVNLAIDRIPPVITVLSPLDDSEVSALPTVHAIYNDGEGYGIAVASDDPLDVPANVEIQITRLTPPDESAIPVNQDELEDTDDSVVYSRDEQLAGGAYRTDVSVTDKWGNRSSGSMEFTVVGTLPSVTILSPMADSVSDDGMPLISAALTGTGALDVVFMIDDEAIDGAVEGNQLNYTPESPLAEGQHTVSIMVTDPDGKTASASVTFSVEFDHSPPVVTQVSPLGVIWGSTATLSVTAIDDQSGVASVSIALDGGEAVDGASRDVEGLALGQHTATATVTNGDGYSQEYSWTFTVAIDEEPPTIGTTSPHGIVRTTMPTISVGATDLTGVASITIGVMNSAGDAVEGETVMDDSGTTASFTPSAELANDTYSVAAVVMDTAGNSASTSWSFTVEASYDTTMPSIDVTSPHGIVRVDMPTISASASDVSDTAQEGLSGIASIEISVDGVDGSSEFDGSGSAIFTPGGALANGTYTAMATATDNSGNTNTASWTFIVEVIMDVAAPVIGNTSPQGISRIAMPEISVAATDELSGIASIEISVMNSAGGAVDGSTAMGDGSAVFTPGAALANDTYTANTTVTDNSGNVSTASWSFVVEVVMDVAEPIIGTTSPSGIVRVDMPTITASATDSMSGVGSIEISVAAGDGSAVGGSSEFDGGTMATFTPNAGLPNDTYTATAVVTDNAGNETRGSWSFTVEVVMDTMPPTITAISPQGLVRTDMPRITVTANDDISGIATIEIRVLNPGLARVAGTSTYEGGTSASFVPDNGLANGTYSVGVDVTDKAGNTANASWSFTLEADRAAPVINTTSPQGTVRDNMPRIDVSATDDLSGIESFAIRVVRSDFLRIDGTLVFEGGTKASFTPANALRNDNYSVAVDVTDKAGNETNVSWSFTVQVDATPPVISASSPMGIVRDDMPRVSVSATDDESGIQDIEIRVFDSRLVRIGGRTVFAGGTTAAFTPERALRNDTYTVGVKAVDKAGNRADASWSFVLEADHTPPVINVTSPQSIIRDDTPRISVSATDDISGIAAIEIRVLNSAFTRIAGRTNYEGGTAASFTPANSMKNDTYTVGVNVTDKAGNTTNADWTFTIEVDKVPPTIGDTGPHGTIATATPRVTVSATDDLPGIRNISIRVVDAAFGRVAGATTFQGGTFASFTPTGTLANGVYSVGVDATDKSGNVATSGWSFTVEVDTTPPVIAHTSPTGTVRPENPIISVSATDDLSGVGSIVMKVTDSNQAAVPGQTVFEGGTLGTFVPARALNYGTHRVSVTVKDKQGNVANATYSFTVESADGLAMLNARNFPNPFAGATKIAFTLTRASEVSIEIFDVSMRPVWNLSRRPIEASTEVVIGWDGATTGGEKLARGVYFCQIMVHDDLNPQYAVLKMAIK